MKVEGKRSRSKRQEASKKPNGEGGVRLGWANLPRPAHSIGHGCFAVEEAGGADGRDRPMPFARTEQAMQCSMISWAKGDRGSPRRSSILELEKKAHEMGFG